MWFVSVRVGFCAIIQDEKIRCTSHYVSHLKQVETDMHAVKNFDRRLPFDIEELAFAAGTEAAIQTRCVAMSKLLQENLPTLSYIVLTSVQNCDKCSELSNGLVFCWWLCVCVYLQADDWLNAPCWMPWDKEVWWVNERWAWESSCLQDFEQGDIDDDDEGKKNKTCSFTHVQSPEELQQLQVTWM